MKAPQLLTVAFSFFLTIASLAQPLMISPGQRVVLRNQTIASRIINKGNLTLIQCTMRGLDGFDEPGGAIQNFGRLTMDRCILQDNEAQFNGGGAIYNGEQAVAILSRCLVRDNFAGFGGAVWNQGILHLFNSTFTNNIADFSGGAIYSDSGAVRTYRTDFLGNACGDGRGGAIDNEADSFLWMFRSRVQFNIARIFEPGAPACGGIYNGAARPAILRITVVSDNLSFAGFEPDPDHNDLCGEFAGSGR